MNADERTKEVESRMFETAAQLGRTFSDLQVMVSQYRSEQEELRNKALAANINFHTEEQAARKLQVSPDTLQRLRKRHERKPGGWPCMRVNSLVRYTDEHLLEIAALLDPRKPQQTAKKSR